MRKDSFLPKRGGVEEGGDGPHLAGAGMKAEFLAPFPADL